MFGQYTDLPRLRNYAQAVRHYNSIAPLRGSNNVRPICPTTNGRRKKHLSIHESTVLGCKAISCRLFNTDVLSFLEDGRVHIDNSYSSMSTNSFIRQILWGVSHVFFNAGRAWLSSNGKHWMLGAELVLLPEDGGWVPETPHRVFRALVNRRASNAALKPYKPFIEHCKNMAKLVDAETVNQASWTSWDRFHLSIKPIPLTTMASPDRLGWGDATLAVLRHGATMIYKKGHWTDRLNGELAAKWLRLYLQSRHAHEVFRLEEVPLGTMVRDANYKITIALTGSKN